VLGCQHSNSCRVQLPLVLLHPGGRSRIFAYLRGPCIKKVHSRCIRFQPGTVAEAFPKADSEPNFPKDLGQFCDRAPIMTEADRVSCLRLQERNRLIAMEFSRRVKPLNIDHSSRKVKILPRFVSLGKLRASFLTSALSASSAILERGSDLSG
jgi:hypothetical protein